jgi:hypothetical protein
VASGGKYEKIADVGAKYTLFERASTMADLLLHASSDAIIENGTSCCLEFRGDVIYHSYLKRVRRRKEKQHQ